LKEKFRGVAVELKGSPDGGQLPAEQAPLTERPIESARAEMDNREDVITSDATSETKCNLMIAHEF
jgi:hypothetical protein